jgi:hypothetical protein
MSSKSVMVLCVLAMVLLDFGPMAPTAFAQRGDNDERGDGENRDRRGGRRGWGRPRGDDNGDDRDRERRRGREESQGNDREPRRRDEGGQSSIDYTEYARELVKKYDKNGNMMLEEDERAKLTGPVARADLDSDKVITVDEIVARLSNSGTSGQDGRSSSTAVDKKDGSGEREAGSSAAATKTRVYTGSVSGSSGKETDKRRSYRFTPAADRITGDLPSWFKSRDRNKDGQVSMSEYSRTWSDRLVREFGQHDRNDDGVVTAKEAAQ